MVKTSALIVAWQQEADSVSYTNAITMSISRLCQPVKTGGLDYEVENATSSTSCIYKRKVYLTL